MAYVFRLLLNWNLNDSTSNWRNWTAIWSPVNKPNSWINGAYEVLNATSYISVPHTTALTFAAWVPFSFWVRFKNLSTSSISYILHKWRAFNAPTWYYHIYNQNNWNTIARIYDNAWFNATVSINTQDWNRHESIVTRDSSNNVTWYLDWKIVATWTANVSVATYSEALFLWYNPDDTRWWDVLIDNAFVDNTALSAAYVKNYNSSNRWFF